MQHVTTWLVKEGRRSGTGDTHSHWLDNVAGRPSDSLIWLRRLIKDDSQNQFQVDYHELSQALFLSLALGLKINA